MWFFLSNGGLKCKCLWGPGPPCEWVNKPLGTDQSTWTRCAPSFLGTVARFQLLLGRSAGPTLPGLFLSEREAETCIFMRDISIFQYWELCRQPPIYLQARSGLKSPVTFPLSVENDDWQFCSSLFIIRHFSRSFILTGFACLWRKALLTVPTLNRMLLTWCVAGYLNRFE